MQIVKLSNFFHFQNIFLSLKASITLIRLNFPVSFLNSRMKTNDIGRKKSFKSEVLRKSINLGLILILLLLSGIMQIF